MQSQIQIHSLCGSRNNSLDPHEWFQVDLEVFKSGFDSGFRVCGAHEQSTISPPLSFSTLNVPRRISKVEALSSIPDVPADVSTVSFLRNENESVST